MDNGIPMTMNVQPSGSNNGNGWGFGGEGSWFIILFLIFAMFSWGGYGFGGNRGGSDGAANGYVLATDFANIERKLDGVNNGICDGFYAMNTGMLNGFANVTQAVNQGFSQAEMAFMQQFSALQAQIANCCCENREAIAQVRYDMATQGCETRTLIQSAARDITDNQNANARAILDALTQQRIEAKDAKIAEQNQQLFACQLAASQSAQNEALKAYMSGQFAYYNPRPVPSFAVPAPYQYGGCAQQCCC